MTTEAYIEEKLMEIYQKGKNKKFFNKVKKYQQRGLTREAAFEKALNKIL
jgi:hypothetical protein